MIESSSIRLLRQMQKNVHKLNTHKNIHSGKGLLFQLDPIRLYRIKFYF